VHTHTCQEGANNNHFSLSHAHRHRHTQTDIKRHRHTQTHIHMTARRKQITMVYYSLLPITIGWLSSVGS